MTRELAATVRVGDSVFSHHGFSEVVMVRTGPSGGIEFRLKYGGSVQLRYGGRGRPPKWCAKHAPPRARKSAIRERAA